MAKFSALRPSCMLIPSCIKGISFKIPSFHKTQAIAHAHGHHSLSPSYAPTPPISDHSLDIEAPASPPEEELPLRVTSTNAHPYSGLKRLRVKIQSVFTKPHDRSFVEMKASGGTLIHGRTNSLPADSPYSQTQLASPHYNVPSPTNPSSPSEEVPLHSVTSTNAQPHSGFKRLRFGIQSLFTKPHDRSKPPSPSSPVSPPISECFIDIEASGDRNSLPDSSPQRYSGFKRLRVGIQSVFNKPRDRSFVNLELASGDLIHRRRNSLPDSPNSETQLASSSVAYRSSASSPSPPRVTTTNAQPYNNNNADQTSPSTATQPKLSNPIAQAFRDLELGKASLGLVIPLGAWILAVVIYTKDDSLIHLYIPAICVAPAALLYGIGLRNMFPRVANAAEQFGVVALCIAFYWPVVSLLPRKLVYLPLAGFLAIGLLSIWSCIRFRYIAQNLVN